MLGGARGGAGTGAIWAGGLDAPLAFLLAMHGDDVGGGGDGEYVIMYNTFLCLMC